MLPPQHPCSDLKQLHASFHQGQLHLRRICVQQQFWSSCTLTNCVQNIFRSPYILQNIYLPMWCLVCCQPATSTMISVLCFIVHFNRTACTQFRLGQRTCTLFVIAQDVLKTKSCQHDQFFHASQFNVQQFKVGKHELLLSV